MDLELRGPQAAPQRRRVEVRDREETFRFKASGPPREVVLDPDGWVLHGAR